MKWTPLVGALLSLCLTTLSNAASLTEVEISAGAVVDPSRPMPSDGDVAFQTANRLASEKEYLEAAPYYWKAVLRKGTTYDVATAYTLFMQMYSLSGKPDEGYLFVAKQYFQMKDAKNGVHYLNEAIRVNPACFEAKYLLAEHTEDKQEKLLLLEDARHYAGDNGEFNSMLGNQYFGVKQYDRALYHLEHAFELDPSLTDAFSNGAYMRSNVCDWGINGSKFESDMNNIRFIVKAEMARYQNKSSNEEIRQSVVHPHMSLGYPIEPELKLYIAKSHSDHESNLVRKHGLSVWSHSEFLATYQKEARKPGFRIKIGYSSANFKSKATLYMAMEVLRFHNRSKFEVHVFATSPPDNERFLTVAMRGVDWRKRVESYVEYFHDVSHLDVRQQADFIRSQGIHVLLDWDGYSNNGVRSAGLFPQQPAPLQICHQEYVGTMGASYIQYIVTDQLASPLELEHIYSEKFIYMPNTFLATSFAYQQPDISLPTYEIDPDDSPQENGCGGAAATFVYCSFNKHLKIEPNVFMEWLKILQEVKGSVLCLLEFPAESKAYVARFVEGFDPKLKKRVRFQPFLLNPYDNQRRVVSMCNAALDTSVYNGHTTSADALWGGVPVVTQSVGKDIGARVGVSMLNVLNLTELIAPNQSEYNRIAKRLALDKSYYESVRRKIVKSCLETNPRNPLWDMHRYAGNLESGFELIWKNFLAGYSPRHVYVDDVGPRAESLPAPPPPKVTTPSKTSKSSASSSSSASGSSSSHEKTTKKSFKSPKASEETSPREKEIIEQIHINSTRSDVSHEDALGSAKVNRCAKCCQKKCNSRNRYF